MGGAQKSTFLYLFRAIGVFVDEMRGAGKRHAVRRQPFDGRVDISDLEIDHGLVLRAVLCRAEEEASAVAVEEGEVSKRIKVGKTEDIQAGIKAKDWNDYIIIAKGNHLLHLINGRVSVDVTDEQATHAAKSGVLAFQLHAGPAMTVEFKNVRLRPIH